MSAREMRIGMLVASGFSRTDAEECDDLAFHASLEAIKTLTRITDTARDQDMQAVTRITAMKMVEAAVQMSLPEIYKQILGDMEGADKILDGLKTHG